MMLPDPQMDDPQPVIRPFLIEDYDDVYALWMSCAGMGLNDIDDSREGIGAFLERNPTTCFVAEGDGFVVGVILVGSDGRRGYIYHAAVSPRVRQRGIAKELVCSAVNALRELGITKVALVAFERNADGNAFWERLGFGVRRDLVYRDLELVSATRIDT